MMQAYKSAARKDIPAYHLFVTSGDIVELLWPFSIRNTGKNTSAESAFVKEIRRLEPLFRRNGHNPITLLNTTAKLELNFLRVILTIPAYHKYVESHDIVMFDPEKSPEIFRGLFKGTQKKLVLLNATAQAALTHHLDDPTSQSMSYQINQRVAQGKPQTSTRQASPRTRMWRTS